ncbi:class I mannose-6-phosphate isomerase [Salipaludibacillus daqingensis]|uniref:class I mannose-6-phosphate isomerase n=1 Tax=Salipaludibacillus daqingensis TaxID=3041001 RepID=UPI002474F8C3|nr:class I mannose-6-phosphate isomerase [Salipaludibacillus daqingensis]
MGKYLKRPANYDKNPVVNVKNEKRNVFQGYHQISAMLKSVSDTKEKCMICVECYPGVREEEIIEGLSEGLSDVKVIKAEDVMESASEVTSKIQRHMTEDRVFGFVAPHRMEEFVDQSKLNQVKHEISQINDGIVLIIGVGATVIEENPDVLIYADLTRWEIQQRFETKEFGNWKADNLEEEPLKKFKRGYFFEWRMADRIKQKISTKADYFLDTERANKPVMVAKETYFIGINQAVNQPFRVVPYFKPGIWGGQWIREVVKLDDDAVNYAWAFDCVPEENSLNLKFGDVTFTLPSINLVYFKPVELMGQKVHARFGKSFPIRFDFLDTMEGQNLSLQVHPLTEYIQDNFGMAYTQDESYYYLDCSEDATIYLGLKEGVDKEEMVADLKRAEKGEISFPDEKYINQFPVKKHDHFSIPAGTIHCSATNSMVLEISATPYIFTFKLWDWDRVDLDGKPRPVHIDHGKEVIQWDRTTSWVESNLINQTETIKQSNGWTEEKTGLHEREFIETRRHVGNAPVTHETGGIVNVLNLVDGEEATIESPTGEFEPYVVHYAETFIIPANISSYTIKPSGPSKGKTIATIKAYVRT